MNLKERAKKLETDIPLIFLALKDRQTPVSAKIAAAATVCYALSPIDLIPDFIPVLGYLDDIIILPAMIAITLKLIPKEIYDRHREQAEHLWDGGKPKNRKYAVPVVIFQILLLGIAAAFLLRLFR